MKALVAVALVALVGCAGGGDFGPAVPGPSPAPSPEGVEMSLSGVWYSIGDEDPTWPRFMRPGESRTLESNADAVWSCDEGVATVEQIGEGQWRVTATGLGHAMLVAARGELERVTTVVVRELQASPTGVWDERGLYASLDLPPEFYRYSEDGYPWVSSSQFWDGSVIVGARLDAYDRVGAQGHLWYTPAGWELTELPGDEQNLRVQLTPTASAQAGWLALYWGWAEGDYLKVWVVPD